MTDFDEAPLRAALVKAYNQVEDKGLMNQSSGNLSCRVPGGMLISCTGASAANLTKERIVMVADDGSYTGKLKPSSEWRMHLEIYRRQDKANAVVHTHSDYCVAVACNNLPLPGFHYMVGLFGNSSVPCVPYSVFGSQELANDAAEGLTDQAACLLGSHGMICRGGDLDIAVGHAERLEIICKHYVLAKSLGEPDLLTDEQWDEFFGRARKVAYSDFI